jgi:hypothetical protein
LEKRFFTLVFRVLFFIVILCHSLFGQNDVILPLNVGNYWEFIDSTFSGDTLLVVDTSKVEITGKTFIEYQNNSYEVYFWSWYDQYTNPPVPSAQKWLIRNESDGLWEYGMLSDTDTLLLQNRHLKFPANVGDSWNIFAYLIMDSTIQVSDTLVMECIATDQAFNTPIGTFQCYVYQYRWIITNESLVAFTNPFKLLVPDYRNGNTQTDTLDFVSFFAPNIGLVGQELRRGALSRKSVLYKINLITDINVIENNLSEFKLFQNYPNPFNPSTKIKFSISEPNFIQIKVFDVLGKEIKTIVNDFKKTGSYEIDFDASNLPSGVYFYRIITGKFSETKKMLLLR